MLAYCRTNAFDFLTGVSKTWRFASMAVGRPEKTSIHLAAATQAAGEWATCDPSFERVGRGWCRIIRLRASANNIGGLKAATAKYGIDFMSSGIARRLGATAAGGGHTEVLAWAVQLEGELCEVTCYAVATGGQFKLLKWAREDEYF